MKSILYSLAVTLMIISSSPIAHAAYFGKVDKFANNITGFFSTILVPLVFAIALVVFLWGMFRYFIAGGGDESSRAQGKSLMVWAIIAFIVMTTIWGIVNFLAAGFIAGAGGTATTGAPANIPTVTVPGG